MRRRPVLALVPLDDRPVTADLPADLARAGGARVRVPPARLLGGRRRPGDVEGVWAWLEAHAAAADAVVASVEMLCFGGLVASRQTEKTVEDVAPLLARLEDLASRVPTYASAVIPRVPREPTDEDAAYWTTGDAAAAARHRQLHHAVHARLVEASRRGTLRSLLIGQDDAPPGSPADADRAALQRLTGSGEDRRVLVTTGADELAARLVARWLVDLARVRPSVRVLYTFPASAGLVPRYEAAPLARTVAEHVASVGCRLSEESADMLLWVHNFDGPQREARDQTGPLPEDAERALEVVRAEAARGRVVALADVRYANGADGALVARLLREPGCAGIAAYAGWNTCSNSLGAALAQAVVAALARRGVLAGDERALRRILVVRLLDDWGYQATARARLADALGRRGGDPAVLGPHRRWCEEEARAMLSRAACAVESAFPQWRVVVRGVEFPWDRLFEARIDADVTSRRPTGPPAGGEGAWATPTT